MKVSLLKVEKKEKERFLQNKKWKKVYLMRFL